MKICERALNWVQVIDCEGTVRLCSWLYDGGVVGQLTKNSFEELYHSVEAKLIRQMHSEGDYSNCNPDACPFVANNDHSNIVEVVEVPRLPTMLALAYENVCNYHCVMCTIPDCMQSHRPSELEAKYQRIDRELEKILPHIKTLSANGLGEFFASPHTMKLMQHWQPLAPVEECRAVIETNGSLFNAQNWQKVSNLGRFHLSVCITVLSFEEETYQQLSGTRLPVANVIDNLHFVRSLREQGVINYLELATVYQGGNFRQLPEFTRRCLEEFGADYVRLRPYEPWVDPGIDEWLRDVRNADNPYHAEFLEVMRDPIFQHPKVHDWGGGQESGLGKEAYPKLRQQFCDMEHMLAQDDLADRVKRYLGSERVTIYGMNTSGRLLLNLLDRELQIPYVMDRGQAGTSYRGKQIYWVDAASQLERDLPVIVTLRPQTTAAVIKLLRQAGYSKQIVPLAEILAL